MRKRIIQFPIEEHYSVFTFGYDSVQDELLCMNVSLELLMCVANMKSKVSAICGFQSIKMEKK